MPNPPAVYPALRNMRPYVSRRLETRPGLVSLYGPLDQLLVHSLRRLNDPIPGAIAAFARIIGSGTKLYCSGDAGFPAASDTGYSGNPLSLIPWRPEQSPEAWMYVGDSTKMRKIRSDGKNFAMGIAPLNVAPTLSLGNPQTQTISDFEAIGAWTIGGTAGALSVVSRMATTIQFITYDTGTTGWAGMALVATTSGVQPGMFLTINSGGGNTEVVLVQDVMRPIAATTIASIAYDTGTTGLCTIQPASLTADALFALTGNSGSDPFDPGDRDRALIGPRTLGSVKGDPRGSHIVRSARPALDLKALGLQPNALLRLNSGGGNDEVVRVLSVTIGPDGSASLRCSTTGTHVAAETITGLATVRTNFANTHVAAETVATQAFQSTITPGTGFMSLVTALNLSTVGGRPVQQDDDIHISILLDHPENLVEGRIFLDFDGTTNDFAHNYFYYAFRQSDLLGAAQATSSVLLARTTAISRGVVDTLRQGRPILSDSQIPIGPATSPPPPLRRGFEGGSGGGVILPTGFNPPVSAQSATGNVQWTELRFKVKDLTRVGTDSSRGLANIAAIRVQLNVNASTVVNVDAWWIGGTFGPDMGSLGAPYLYRVRGRSSLTGAKSNPSPPPRSGITARRQSIVVQAANHPDTQVDLLDYFRWGGALLQWTYAGTGPNGSPPPPFTDSLPDDAIINAPILQFDNFQPFPTVDLPRTGTCDVVGTKVTWKTGDVFNVGWALGSIITINGVTQQLYASPTSTTKLEIVDNAGSLAGVTFAIKQATLLAQALPALWGPFQGFLLACGDLYQPGTLFITRGNDPDTAPDVNTVEITTPSEPLMNGCLWDGRPFVWSSQRFFALYPTFEGGFVNVGGQVVVPSAAALFAPLEVPNGKGLFARWFFTVGPKIWFGAADGIYEITGGEPQSITLEDLYYLFPHDGQPGVAVTLGSVTIQPPDFTKPTRLRLAYSDGFLYFDYLDILGNSTSLVYNTILRVWAVDTYSTGIDTHYAEEGQGVHSLLAGGINGKVFQMTGTQDEGTVISCEVDMAPAGYMENIQHIRDGIIGLLTSTNLSLIVNVDGVDYSVTLTPYVAGIYTKTYTPLPAVKGKVFAYRISNVVGGLATGPFTLFQKDCTIHQKQWAGASYTPINPFADLKRESRLAAG